MISASKMVLLINTANKSLQKEPEYASEASSSAPKEKMKKRRSSFLKRMTN